MIQNTNPPTKAVETKKVIGNRGKREWDTLVGAEAGKLMESPIFQ
ncbi:MAG: hypothetical protein R3F31_04540 [Verrucomicrobiales bacterium]